MISLVQKGKKLKKSEFNEKKSEYCTKKNEFINQVFYIKKYNFIIIFLSKDIKFLNTKYRFLMIFSFLNQTNRIYQKSIKMI